MARKDRSDMKVETFSKKKGVPPGTIRNDDGKKRDMPISARSRRWTDVNPT